MLLLGLALASMSNAADPGISLSEAVRQALASNLDLVAQRQALAAAREDVGLARSALLPQLGIGARAQVLDEDRSDSLRDSNRDRSLLFAAGLSQAIYDEGSWAGFDIRKHVYNGQVRELEAFRLEVIQDAANSFLELDRWQQLLEIQMRNRLLTLASLDKSRSRIAAGWSSENEILRWETQLATNDTDVRAAEVRVLQNDFELNRVRNRPPEAPTTALRATVDDYGFVYTRETIANAVLSPGGDRGMRNFLVRLGLERSPDLAALDASIGAAERQLTSSRRAFWVPKLGLSAGVDHLTNQRSGDNSNKTEWLVKGELTFPLYQGGARRAGLDQAREALASLRTERRATSQSLEQAIRAAFAQASGSFESVSFADRQLAAAARNFEIVDASYTLGVASILDLLDAQSELLRAELGLTNARYSFLEDLVAAEREISFYAFLQAPADVETLLNELVRVLGLAP